MNQISQSLTTKATVASSAQLQMTSVAKINLFLHIVAKRHDGYHDLQTVFRLLDWGDTLNFCTSSQHFEPIQLLQTSTLPIDLHCAQQLTEKPQDNLIIKAAIKLLQWLHQHNRLPDSLPFITTHLKKNLPTGAGLGGGSSNAATTLIALNQLWQLNINRQNLLNIGAQIGADVPIFIFGQDAIAEGIGEQLSCINLPKQHYLLLCPKAHISTAKLFSHHDLCRDMPPLSLTDIQKNSDNYLFDLQPPYCNVFEPVVTQLAPSVKQALDFLRTLEHISNSTARMTGSGSCVYLPFREPHLEQIQTVLTNAPCLAKIVSSK
ncbi:4-(cytidine 5'-diphospho)-2-C-methyl-D-erythritol kinase [Psychrobacter sp. I-STPA10]|uniref:4-(cytidine 5'-diphospho)-2-C-methyl-D-erythritol kinase n=1 Tax=Psychrobacter sp. I-STPA10 TaxID=2585769 RepID=UPI001E2D92E9|nr:4-(cytidine 5'-diphospho)-2-C-methyl-D-erythritol kinase [Psychrobacter sp. I-STPA10]